MNNRIVPATVVRPARASSPRSARPTPTATAVQIGYGEIDPRKVNKPEPATSTRRA